MKRITLRVESLDGRIMPSGPAGDIEWRLLLGVSPSMVQIGHGGETAQVRSHEAGSGIDVSPFGGKVVGSDF